jgi:3,4-dihydroxyphenylacetate 2,3-dioxygenase
LGWTGYNGAVDMVTPYFGASGTGQLNAIFEVTAQDGAQVPGPVASQAEGYTAISTRL